MIMAGTRFAVVRVPMERIVVSEHQARYPERVLHYVRLLSDPCHATSDTGPIALAAVGRGLYRILDGHHRYVAHIIAGRTDILALLEIEPGQVVPEGIVCTSAQEVA